MKKWLGVCLLSALILVPALSPGNSGDVYASAPASDYTLVYADEFDGTAVNESDWMYRDAGPYSQGYNRKENVRESGGSLHIDFKHELIGSTWYNTCGGIISKKLFGYGYYETRAKLFNATTGLHSSFWSMGLSNHIASDNVTGLTAEINAGNLPYYNQVLEIDGFEKDSASGISDGTVIHVNGYGNVRGNPGVTTPDQWHVYGYDWEPTFIKFYVDDVLINTINFSTTPQPFSPANFWLTALGYSAVSDYTKLPGESQFDYFRYYAKSNPGANRLGNGAMEFTPKDTSKGYTDQDSPAWIEYYDKDSSFMTTTDHYLGSRALEHLKTSAYLVTTKQILNGIPNGTYKLTAYIKSSGGQAEAKMRVLNYGGTELIYNIPATSTWTPITIDNVQVTNNQATIAFTSNASANQWLLMDEVNFAEKVTGPITLEAKSLPVNTSAGDSQTNYTDTPAGKTFNNLNATAVNDYVEYTVNVTDPGTYTVYIGNRTTANKAIYQLAVAGTNLGGTVDEYTSVSGYTETNSGNVTFSTAGNKTFRFTVTSKNASSSGYQLAYDYIKLVKN